MIRLRFKLAILMAALTTGLYANDRDWPQLGRYEAANKELMAQLPYDGRVVFIGNSITDYWASMRPDFFSGNMFVGRGISGQTSYQFLVRFRDDVVALSPKAVVINVATNDIAENTCPYDEDRTLGNLKSMVEIARANGIDVILSSVLPAKSFGWNPGVKNAPEKIRSLNRRIENYAKAEGIPFIDYYSALVDADGESLNPAFSEDGVHPNAKGYEIMEAIALPIIRTVTGNPAEAAAKERTYTLVSPGKVNEIVVTVGDTLSYSVCRNGRSVADKVTVVMNTGKGEWGVAPKVRNVSRGKIDESYNPAVPLKYSVVKDCCNSLRLDMKDGYSVEFRAYDDGVAHRFIGNDPGSLDIVSERFDVAFPAGTKAHLQETGSFKTSYENPYSHISLGEWNPSGRMSTLPVLMEIGGDGYVLVSESDLKDYPAMFLKGDGKGGFTSVFPKVPLKWGEDGDRSVKILEEAPYIARTEGSREFPWRFMAIGSPKNIVEQTMAARLGGRPEIAPADWIKPGMASWEWWNGATPYGPDVDFESGFNMNTYKYFIDFAAKYGIPYIIMDKGWAMDTRDPYTPNPEVNVKEIVRYGKEKGVGVFLWLTWLTVENNFDLFKTFSDWGVKGVKIDFMDRSDQWMVNFYERVLKESAKNRLLVDMHGSFKPAGLEQRYPNLLSYEGVRGMEQMGGCRPDNSLWLPFMRNAVGPMDYTPGAMISMQPEYYVSERPNSASIGTRAYQMALFVVFESGLQMLADNPTLYYRNNDCTEFIASVPVTWDETHVIEAVPGEYLILAKRKGDTWYIGAIANGAEKRRHFTLNLDFLKPDRKYRMVWFEDGPNAHRQAMDYRRKTMNADSTTMIPLEIVRNGGWVARIEPE